MTQEQKELKEAWLEIVQAVESTGFEMLYMDSLLKVAKVVRKEIGLDQ